MKKILPLFFCSFLTVSLFAQQDSTMTTTSTTPTTPTKKQPINLSNRSNDHFLLQIGYTGWAGKPDSIHTGSFSKSLNVYFMFDFPFKTNPKLSMAFGPGISTDNIVFKKTYVGIKDQTTVLNFTNQADTNHYKRTKLVTAYVEAPIEFRYVADPEHNAKSFKFAVGVKVGLMLAAHTRNKDLQTSSNSTLNSFILKENSKHFFNSNRLSVMGRVGKGHLSVYGTYQVTSLFKDGVAAEIHPYSIGLTLSGL